MVDLKLLKGRYADYKSRAKKKAREFDLTLDEFKLFWQKPCIYCGGSIVTVGLDRVDSTKGYSLDNIVSCCSHCNWSKGNRSVIEFFEWIAIVYKRNNT